MFWFSKKKAEGGGDSNHLITSQALTDNIDSIVIFLDAENRVKKVNKRAKDLLAVEPKQLEGKIFPKLFLFKSKTIVNQKFLQALEKDKTPFSGSLDLFDKFGNQFQAQTKFIPKINNQGDKLVILEEIRREISAKGEKENLQFLARAALKLIDPMPEQELYQYVAEQVATLAPDSYISVNIVFAPNRIRTIAAAKSSNRLDLGLKMIGDPIGMEFDINEKATFSFERGKLLKVVGGINELTFGKIPKPLARLVEKAAGVTNIFIVGFFWRGKLFGNVTIITREKADPLHNAATIETFVNQAAVAIQRKKTEEQLKESVVQLDNEKNKVTRERDKIDIIIHSIGDGIFVVDNDFSIILMNKIAENISGLELKNVVGKKYSQVFKFFDKKEKKAIENIIEKSVKEDKISKMPKEAMLIRGDGLEIPIDSTISPLKSDGKSAGCVVVFRDVTKERQVDQAKSEFVSLASHQLRTPLSAINWYTEMLLDEDAGRVNKNQKDYLDEIYASSQRMVDLVNALLNVSRLELGTFVVEPQMIDFCQIADSVIKELTPRILAKKVKIIKNFDQSLGKISADPELVRIIFQNLISNSVKYTPAKGEVKIKISKDKTKDEGILLIEIADNGYGIPKKQQSEVFSKLFRADNIKLKETEGTGLGLYIVKSIVDHSKGKVWFESPARNASHSDARRHAFGKADGGLAGGEENKGTTFYVQLPLSGMPRKAGTKILNAEELK